MDLTFTLYLLSLCWGIFGARTLHQRIRRTIGNTDLLTLLHTVTKDVREQDRLNCLEMRKHEWYKGSIGRNAAEHLLLARLDVKYVQPDGAFLVRDSESSPGDYTLSVKANDSPSYPIWPKQILKGVHSYRLAIEPRGKTISDNDIFIDSSIFGDAVEHMRILRDGKGKFFLWVVKFDTVLQIITHHRTSSVSRNKKLYLTDMEEMDLEAELESEKRYIANHDFMPRTCDELLLKQGDVIIVSKREYYAPGWWEGRKCRTFQEGIIPRIYVEELNT